MGDKPPAAGGLGRYHLGEPLGGGPTGEVFRAKVYGVAGFERQYALKRFHAALAADPTTAEILAAAARSYATVSHPHIARLHEYGVAQGQSFVAVELVSGLDAARLLGSTVQLGDPVPRGSMLLLIGQIFRGVAYGHARGIAHLGICPTNVIITADGEPKVADFGLLRSRLGTRPAEDPTMLARIPYLAPEQLEAVAGTAATDVFQLATLAYELLVGEKPFTGKSGPEVAAAILATPPPPNEVPGPIWEVLGRAFAREPGARYPSAVAFADAYDAAVKRLALPGGRPELVEAIKRAQARTADLSSGNASGALSFPLPAPPPSTPGVHLSSLFASGEVPRRTSPRTTLSSQSVPVPPPPPPEAAASSSTPISRPPSTASSPPPLPPAILSPSRPLTASVRLPPPPPESPTPTPLPPPAPASQDGDLPPARKRSRARREPLPPLPSPMDVAPLASRRSRWPVYVLVSAVLAAGGYLVYDQVFAEAPLGGSASDEPAVGKPAHAAPDAGPVATAAIAVPVPIAQADAAATPVAAAPPAPPDAARAAQVSPPDAAPLAVTAPHDEPPVAVTTRVAAPAPDGKLVVVSDPPGAELFLDGASKGRTPVELPASGDKHKVALFLAGYKLARLDIDGHGKTAVTLEKVDRFRGPAGIKVRCSTRRRMVVLVDDRDTGLLCPTERIAVELGEHTVGTYDPQSEEVSKKKVQVKDTHFSVKVTAP